MPRKFDFDDTVATAITSEPKPNESRSYGGWNGMLARSCTNFGVEVFQGGRWVGRYPTPEGDYPLLKFKAFVERLQSDRCRGLFRRWSARGYAKTLAAVCKLAEHLHQTAMFTDLLLARMEEADSVDIRTEAARRRGADASLHDFPPAHHDEYLSKIITGHIAIGS